MAIRNLAADIYLNTQTGKTDVPYPSKTELVRAIMASMCEAAAGTIASATGASTDVVLPFDPAVVFVWDLTKLSLNIKLPTQPTDVAIQIILAAASVAGCITLGTLKFTIGTNANINSAADVLHWCAFGFRGNTGTT